MKFLFFLTTITQKSQKSTNYQISLSKRFCLPCDITSVSPLTESDAFPNSGRQDFSESRTRFDGIDIRSFCDYVQVGQWYYTSKLMSIKPKMINFDELRSVRQKLAYAA